jgi:hypothetical protein
MCSWLLFSQRGCGDANCLLGMSSMARAGMLQLAGVFGWLLAPDTERVDLTRSVVSPGTHCSWLQQLGQSLDAK